VVVPVIEAEPGAEPLPAKTKSTAKEKKIEEPMPAPSIEQPPAAVKAAAKEKIILRKSRSQVQPPRRLRVSQARSQNSRRELFL